MFMIRKIFAKQAVRAAMPLLLAVVLSYPLSVSAQEDVPDVEIVSVTPQARNELELVPEWEIPNTPQQLTGPKRQELLEYVSGGGSGGVPLLNVIQTQGRIPDVRQLILSVKRPWYVHRAFLSSEGAEFADVRSVMRFGDSPDGRAIVGINLVEGRSYLFDFLVDGQGEGTYVLNTDSGSREFADPDGNRNNVLVALKAEQSGWTELSLSRTAGGFDLHSVEVTLAVGPEGE